MMGTRVRCPVTPPTNPNTFSIETKGICFLCLRLKNNIRTACSTGVTTTHSFQKLSKYVELDFQRVFNISIPNGALDDTELLVSLCNTCSEEYIKFFQLYKELEEVMAKMNVCVQTMHQLMAEADKNPVLREQYRLRMIATNPNELIQASIAENFRKELKDKFIKKTGQENNLVASGRKRKPLPNLMQMGAPSGGRMSGGKRLTEPHVNQNLQHQVECVDLDSDDEGKNSPDLVISSVSGANGETIMETGSSGTTGSSTNSHQEIDSFLQSLFTTPSSTTVTTERAKSSKESPDPELWSNVGEGRLQCKVCEKVLLTSNAEILLNHERIHSGDMPIKCIYCPQRFRNNWTLRFHFVSYHRAELLAKFKADFIPMEEFRKLVEHVILLGSKREPNGNRSCMYCMKSHRQRNDAEAHLVQHHYDNLGQHLVEIQNNADAFNAIISPVITNPLLSGTSFNSLQTVPSAVPVPMPIQTTDFASRVSSGEISVTLQPPAVGLPNPLPTNPNPIPMSYPAVPRRPSKTVFRCHTCKKFFSGFQALRKHRLSVHSNPTSSVTTAASTPTSVAGGITITPVMVVTTPAPIAGASPKPKPKNQNPANKDADGRTYKCEYCKSSPAFKFYSTFRIHQLNAHKLEVLSKHLDPSVTFEEINEILTKLLQEQRPIGSHCGCKYCDRLFTPNEVDLSQLRNHMILAHFEILVEGLKQGVEEKRKAEREQQEPTPTELIIPKEEEPEVVEILPD